MALETIVMREEVSTDLEVEFTTKTDVLRLIEILIRIEEILQ